jgi:hypothetical protein
MRMRGFAATAGSPPNAKPATSATTGNTAEQNRLKPFTGKPFELSNELELDSQKGNPGSYAMQQNHSRGRLLPSSDIVQNALNVAKGNRSEARDILLKLFRTDPDLFQAHKLEMLEWAIQIAIADRPKA